MHVRVDMYDPGIFTCRMQIKFFLTQQVMNVNSARRKQSSHPRQAALSFQKACVIQLPCPVPRFLLKVAPPSVFWSEDPQPLSGECRHEQRQGDLPPALRYQGHGIVTARRQSNEKCPSHQGEREAMESLWAHEHNPTCFVYLLACYLFAC